MHNYIPVASSNIEGYFYDEKNKKLYIKFLVQREYEYSDVSQEEMDKLLEADSFGAEFRSTIVGKKQTKEITVW